MVNGTSEVKKIHVYEDWTRGRYRVENSCCPTFEGFIEFTNTHLDSPYLNFTQKPLLLYARKVEMPKEFTIKCCPFCGTRFEAEFHLYAKR